ncbi:MAG TPA: type IX secretion system membrane protein PorP/SprF [Ohtaekwangia sp.]|nr:type IX secretion system membrane protein PorP/SprF [Ohtaekwangia sp.]
MKKLLLFFLSFVTAEIYAQDVQFSQYYQAPLYLNPAFTGITEGHRLVANHRIQWPGLPQAFATYSVSYDVYSENLRSGFGIMAMNDRMGSAGWQSTAVQGLYSYKIKLSENLVFSPGLSFGYGSNGLDRSKVRLADGLQYDGQSLDPELYHLEKQQYFDFTSGFVLYSKRAWLGASFAHMNRPNLSVTDGDSRLPMKTTIHGGMRINFIRSRRAHLPYLTPSFIYKIQGPLWSQLDLGMNFHVDPVAVGIWYRGKPFSKDAGNNIDQDAVIFFTGLYLKNLTVGYSYDFTISKLRSHAGGAHEISIMYEFTRKKTGKKQHKLIPCPAFYNNKQ